MKKMTGMMTALAATLLSYGLAEANGGGGKITIGKRTAPNGRESKGIVVNPAHGPTIRMGSIDRVNGPDAQRFVVDGKDRDLRVAHQEFQNGKERWGLDYDGKYRDLQIGRVSKPNGVDKFGVRYDGVFTDFRFGVRW